MIQTIDHAKIRELRLNRPPVNALSPELIVALRLAIEAAPGNGVGAIVLSGTPGRFSGGLDVPLLLTLDAAAMDQFWHDFYRLLAAIAKSPVPIVAAITGHAPAGGTVLTLFCDWRIMAEGEFNFGLNEVQVGIPLPPVILAGLQRLVGLRRAERLAVTGALHSPSDSLRLGLVDELAPVERVVPKAREWCRHTLALPRDAMQSTRRLARADLAAIFESDLQPELQRVTATWWSPETQATLRALAERLGKKPR